LTYSDDLPVYTHW